VDFIEFVARGKLSDDDPDQNVPVKSVACGTPSAQPGVPLYLKDKR
jgi:hypothetical protein